jgi:nicotinamidase-related amidase
MALVIDRRKTAFLALHFQNDIVHEKGKLAPSGMVAHVLQTNCLQNTSKAIEASRRAGIPVIHVVAKSKEGYREFAGALQEGTWGAEIHDEVEPQAGDPVVTGRKINAFYGTDLESVLSMREVTSIILSGVSTNFVVESTARYGADAGYKVIILRDCCASFNEEMHSFTLNNVLHRLAIISNSEEYIKALR